MGALHNRTVKRKISSQVQFPSLLSTTEQSQEFDLSLLLMKSEVSLQNYA